ncbi:MAG: amidase [Acetobacteraceae bacterium]
MPTTYNSPIYQGMQTGRDAACVAVVRHSGALILGKTDTVEFAGGGRKALTTHPMNPAHTPGGSSSGSGAAVGDFMVPLAFGTQTGGSLIRPAAFNGIYGIKPTYGVVSREGAKMYSYTLDTIGWYGRSVDDLALVAGAFRLPGIETQRPVEIHGLRVGLCESPQWNRADPAMRAGAPCGGGAAGAGGRHRHPRGSAARVREARRGAGNHHAWRGAGGVSCRNISAPTICWPTSSARRWTAATASRRSACSSNIRSPIALRPQFDRLFDSAFDVVLTPAAIGEAPVGLHTTGDHLFNKSWTLLHVPCVAIPAGRGPQGLPLGLQVVGRRFGDAAPPRHGEGARAGYRHHAPYPSESRKREQLTGDRPCGVAVPSSLPPLLPPSSQPPARRPRPRRCCGSR